MGPRYVLCARMCVHTCARDAHVEVRGQPTRVNSLLPPCRSQKQTRVMGLGCSCLYLLSHLYSPKVGIFDLGPHNSIFLIPNHSLGTVVAMTRSPQSVLSICPLTPQPPAEREVSPFLPRATKEKKEQPKAPRGGVLLAWLRFGTVASAL